MWPIFDACKEFIETVIKEQGRIDILVNNAGITKDGLLMKMSEEDFDKVLDTNLKGTFHTIRAALRQMIRQRSGRIINMASVVGVSGNAGQANLCGVQSRCDRTDQNSSQRSGIQRNHGQCSCTGIYRDRHDRSTSGKDKKKRLPHRFRLENSEKQKMWRMRLHFLRQRMRDILLDRYCM